MKFQERSIIRHRNGTEYEVLLGPDRVKLESNAAPAYAYTAVSGDDKTIWVRDQVEMEDGRFKPVSPPQSERFRA